MKLLIGSAVVGTMAVASGVVLYRRSRVWRFRRFLRELPNYSRPVTTQWIRNLDVEQGIALRKVLEGDAIPTEVKVEMCELLLEFGKFSRAMKSDYLSQLMLTAGAPLQERIAQLALQFAASESSALRAVLSRLEDVRDPILLEVLLTGLASIAAAIPVGSRSHGLLPTESDRTAIMKKVAYNLGNADEGVRRTAARLLRSTLVGSLTEAEGVFMELLRSQRKEIKQLVAELVLEHQDQLKAAMCSVRVVTKDLSHELRARV